MAGGGRAFAEGQGLRIGLLGPAHPLRGGISQYLALLDRELVSRGHEVFYLSLIRQYPSFLFPGQSQNDPSLSPLVVPNERVLDPMNPLRQVDPDIAPAVLHVSSLEGYGAPIIDISHELVGADLSQVVGTMRNFIPDRMVRATGKMQRMNIDDGDIYLGEFANGALCSIQTSYVTVGNYPGIEARLYGSNGAIICRLVEEDGICERIWLADKDHVEFKRAEIPKAFYPPGGSAGESWRTLFYANLVSSFITEILAGDTSNEGNFDDGAWVQETINAVELSFRERRWVTLPLA